MSTVFVATVDDISRVIEGNLISAKLLRLIVLDFLSWWLEIH